MTQRHALSAPSGSSSPLHRLPGSRVVLLVASLVAAFSLAGPAEAASHRARLARDLADRIAAGSNEAGHVILEGDRAKVERLAERYGLRIHRRLRHGAVVELTGGQLDALSQDPEVDHLSSDLPVRSTMAVTTVATGADQVWQGLEGLRAYTGRGIGIAVIDSGIADHPALRSRVVASVDFTDPEGQGLDEHGHGTHVAGIIAGATRDGEFTGMAPGAHLVSLRVLGPDGSGTTSAAIDALDWVVENRRRYRIRIVNLSLGHPPMEPYRDDPLCQAVERVVRAGVLVVASAGNLGQTEDGQRILGGINSPGTSPWALTVGAVDTQGTPERSDDEVTPWSSIGPTYPDGLLKPDLVAPGRRIVSLGAEGSTLWTNYADLQRYGASGTALLRLSGTSQATAVASGTAALLLDAQPNLSPLAARAVLQLGATRIADEPLITAGAGEINAASTVALVRQHGSQEQDAIVIAGEPQSVSGVAILSSPELLDKAPSCVQRNAWGIWGNHREIIWGNHREIIWGNHREIIWGSNWEIIWGNYREIIWGNHREIIWGNHREIIWGNHREIIWGNNWEIIWDSSRSILES